MHVSGKVSKFLRWLMNVNVIFFSNLISVPPRLFSALSRVWQTWKLTIRKTFLLFYFCNVIGAIWNAWMRMSFIPNGARIAVSDVLYLKVSKSQKQFFLKLHCPTIEQNFALARSFLGIKFQYSFLIVWNIMKEVR